MSRTGNIQRNNLDYILTDSLPVELSELFSFDYFYKFLLQHEKKLQSAVLELQMARAKGNSIMFDHPLWNTMPLKYKILKGTDSTRELNVVQPLSAMNMYLFIECYKKDVLNTLDKGSVLSLRYHKQNNELYYKQQGKSILEYFHKSSKHIDKNVIEQTGVFFKIGKFNSVNQFVGSRIWEQCNFRFKYFARIDYKACFDSIYSHAFKWVIEKNVIDSKNAKNGNLYMTIDRILQNINGHSSNGVIVGPEFSRMISEILLQQIDKEVVESLSSDQKKMREDYIAFRYVDDIFIFADTVQDIDLIIEKFSHYAGKYLLRINELKISKQSTPVADNAWLSKARTIADRIAVWFNTKSEYSKLPEEDKTIVKEKYLSIERVKDDFLALILEFPKEKRVIVAYLLSTILNKIEIRRTGYKLFKDSKENKAFSLLELAFFLFSYSSSYDNSHRLISMIVYFNDELNFKNNIESKKKLQRLLLRYDFSFRTAELNDVCDWFAFFDEYGIHFNRKTEEAMEANLNKENNPILWANYLIYSRYNAPYNEKILKVIENIVINQIECITLTNQLLHREIWNVFIFFNCPFISNTLKVKLLKIISDIKLTCTSTVSGKMLLLLCEYMQNSSKGFFTWTSRRQNFGKELTYKTSQRTLFRKYKFKNNSSYGSLDL